jgi:hypothetical protein
MTWKARQGEKEGSGIPAHSRGTRECLPAVGMPKKEESLRARLLQEGAILSLTTLPPLSI